MDSYTAAWVAWIGMFLVIEISALKNKEPGDILSEHIWNWASIGFKRKGWRARRVGLLLFLTWLSAHWLTGGWV